MRTTAKLRDADLLPCPFCGSAMMLRDALWPSEGDTDGILHAAPTDCPLSEFSVSTADECVSVAAAWNKRSAQEWQDISTAKDGVPVLGMNKHGDIGHTHRVESDGDVPAYWWNDQDDDEWHPLWWMPALPPMPNTLIAEERTDG